MSSQYTTFSVHGQSCHHLSCQCPVSTLSLLPMSCQNIMPLAHYQSEDLMFCPCTVSMPHLLPKSSPYSIHHVHFQTEYHIYCPCTISTSPLLPKSQYLLPMSTNNATSPAIAQSEYSLLPMLSQYTLLPKVSQLITSPTQVWSE